MKGQCANMKKAPCGEKISSKFQKAKAQNMNWKPKSPHYTNQLTKTSAESTFHGILCSCLKISLFQFIACKVKHLIVLKPDEYFFGLIWAGLSSEQKRNSKFCSAEIFYHLIIILEHFGKDAHGRTAHGHVSKS